MTIRGRGVKFGISKTACKLVLALVMPLWMLLDFWPVKKRKEARRWVLGVMFMLLVLFTSYLIGFPRFVYRVLGDAGHPTCGGTCRSEDHSHVKRLETCRFRSKYPLTSLTYDDGVKYRISVVADLDEERSKLPGVINTWRSVYKEGYLVHRKDGTFHVEWDPEPVILKSSISEKGRGLELSELVVFNGKLLSVDDRTGIVYEIKHHRVFPWVILNDGDGSVSKGFKGEWMTVKDRTLFVGGLGKEWTTQTGEVVNFNPQYVKSVGVNGEVIHHNWRQVYEDIKTAVGITSPGYVIHEAACWSTVKKRWFFLPRRASNEKYDDQKDEQRGTNLLISCDDHFKDFKVTRVGKRIPTHGFSSFKFVPGFSDDVIIALKSVEDKGNISSYIMIFKTDGEVLMDEKLVGDEKFEGVEFI